MSRPTVGDVTGDHVLARLARRHWLIQTPNKVLVETVGELWDAVEADANPPFAILLLEQLQTLERYLWPGYDEDASNQHVLLIALLVNIKRREHLPVWPTFSEKPDEFSSLFRRITHLSVDSSLPINHRTQLIVFLVNAFQSLDNAQVRRECQPLVSIGIWQHLHSDLARERCLRKSQQLQKAWRVAGKRLDSAEVEGQARLRFERSWLYTLLMSLTDVLYQGEKTADDKQDGMVFCLRVLELLCDMLSQLPTRRYVNTLLHDLNFVDVMRLSPMYQDGDATSLLREMTELAEHYMHFSIDDFSGKQLSPLEMEGAHNFRIAQLQNVALKMHPEKLKILVLANYGSLIQKDELEGHFKALDDNELVDLCSQLGLRTSYPDKSKILLDRAFYTAVIATSISQQKSPASSVRNTPILPTETDLYNISILRADTYDGSRPLPLPKLNLQYLSVTDFLHRSFTLYHIEALYGIRQHLEDTLKRLQPRSAGGQLRFDGFSRMAIPISKPAIIESLPARVGEDVPAEVKAEVILDVGRLQPGLRREWEGLKEGDVVFLVGAQQQVTEGQNSSKGSIKSLTNGHTSAPTPAERAGLKMLRCAEVISVLDENSRVLRRQQDVEDHLDGYARPRQRRLLLRLDAQAFQQDKERADSGKDDPMDAINLIIRRRSRENNFRAVLDTIKGLALQAPDVPLPVWLHDVFLGFGDPSAATYKRLPNRLAKIDYRDTFLDWQHLIESLPGKTVEPDPSLDASFPPPYILDTAISATTSSSVGPRPSKKRRLDQANGPEMGLQQPEIIKVTTYNPPHPGPYPSPIAAKNSIRFTPTQISAISSGVQPGLTMILGPPGTGKTDTVTQIVRNIYHNFPQERILLVAHSNQALDQLFSKLTAAGGVEDRHLLRLGHAVEDGDARDNERSVAASAGRLERVMEQGGMLLGEVQRLADSIQAAGAHGGSCETAEYFDRVFVAPRWKRFWKAVESHQDVSEAFPFHAFFANSPLQPLFPPSANREQHVEVAKACEQYLSKIFEELRAIRPFELLRHQRERTDYLLVNEARIVAMTTTHAAIRRGEIARLGFRYESLIMEEAAQVAEIEAFVPMVLQQPAPDSDNKTATGRLKRIVLVGDHLQNAPIIQSHALASYAGLQQSLFQRLIRLGVPHIILDAQGRSRPSLAALVRWRYPSLRDLEHTRTAPEFVQANAGLRFEYQFVDVEDYKGQGESEPAPHYYQNLGEAEYAVALYQYMRLLGYPADKISILCAYAGQRALVRDVLAHRCKGNRLFGLPGWVGTVDKYQGEQNDYVILSLVRTKGNVGFMRDVRRLAVALSRARLGLYVLGRREIFENGGLEVREAFQGLLAREGKLRVVAGETWGAVARHVDTEVESVVMEGVTHLGKYVYEMTQAKVKALSEGIEAMPPAAPARMRIDDDVEEDEEAEYEDTAALANVGGADSEEMADVA